MLLGLAAASPALAKTKPPPAPIQLLCSASANGGALVNGVCVLPAGVAGGANTYYGIIAVSNPNAGDTFKVISGTVPPGLAVLPQYGSGTIVTGTPTQAGTFVFTEQLRAEQRAWRLAEMRRRLGITQAEVAQRIGVTQGRVSAIEHAKPGTTELRTLASYVEALGGRLEIIADFGDERLAFAEPGTEAA